MSQETEKGCLQGLGIGFGLMSAPFLIGIAVLVLVIFLCVICIVSGGIIDSTYNNIITPVP